MAGPFSKAQNWEDWQLQSSIWSGVLPKKYHYFYLETAPKNLKQSNILCSEVEMFLEQRDVAFLSPSKICESLNFSREMQPISVLKLFLLYLWLFSNDLLS